MKRILLLLLCLLLLVIPVSAETAQAQITSYDAVYTVADDGVCHVTVTVSVAFPENAASFSLPVPTEAEQISAPGLSVEQLPQEDRVLLLLTKSAGFSASDAITVSYQLPQTVEEWDGKQTLTLPLLFDDWNCSIASFHATVNLPAETDIEPTFTDEDGDSVKDFLFVTANAAQLTLETGGKAFTPETRLLKMEFRDAFFPQLSHGAGEETPDITQIDSMDIVCSVLEDSSCSVSVDATYTFYDHPNTLRIPVPSDAYEISVGGMQYTKKSESDCTVLLLENPSGFSGSQSFHVSYRLLTTAVEEDGAQEFSLPLIYSQWDYRIHALTLTVHMPSEFEGLPEFISSYYNDQIDNFLEIAIDGDTIHTASLQALMEQESLSVHLSLAAGFFDLRFLQGRFSSVETILFWLAAALCVIYWFFFIRIRIRRITPESSAPLGCNAGQIPYILRLKAPSFGLMTATWASLGYLTLERTRSKQQYLVRRMDMQTERSRCEMQLFSALFARKEECRVHSPAYQTAAGLCVSYTQDDWHSRLLRRRGLSHALPLQLLGLTVALAASLSIFDRIITPQSFRWLLIIPLAALSTLAAFLLQQAAGLLFVRHPWKKRLACIAAFLLLLVLGVIGDSLPAMLLSCLIQIFIGIVLLPGAKRSSGGVELFYQLLGLRRYLRKLDVSDLEQLLENDPQYYYRILPYAEALGIGARFTRKFSGFRLEPCHWFDWKGQSIDRAEDFYRRFSLMLDEMDNTKKQLQKH